MPNKIKLTDAAIARASARKRPYRIWDLKVPGLYVRVQPSGVKSYNVQWSRTGSTSIGKHPHSTLDWARTEAHRLITEAKDHGTPAAARKKGKSLTFDDFLTKHYAPWAEAELRSGKQAVTILKAHFQKRFGSKPISELTAWAVERFRADRLKAGIKRATVKRDVERLRAALNKAHDWKLVDTKLSGIKQSKPDQPRVRYLKPDEEKRLRAALAAREAKHREQRDNANAWAKVRGYELRPTWAADDFTDHLAPLVLAAINTGLRRGELFGLTWDQVDLDHHKQLTVTAATSKTGEVRHVPLNSEALDVFKRWQKYHGGSGLIFPGLKGRRLTHINKAWAGVVKTAKLKDFHFHDLRHHFASYLVMGHVDLYTVQQLLGHSDAKMTQRYAHLSPEHKQAAVEKLVARR